MPTHRERHFTERIGWLRAAVLGANDGIVSTASLLVGVAAAAAPHADVMIAGIAGLVAGAMSMAAGEYVSVSSQADTERADLARECETSETMISRVINAHFQKSFPQLMNERRIEDAKQLLRETDATIQAIAKDVGFNSLPSFNRVFKELVSQAPSQYRKKTPQNTN